MRPGPPLQGGEARDGRARTFSQDYRPCGQPVAEGGSGRLRPVPPQAGHFKRMNAMPSDFPFRSTGFATYPVPPQFGQSFGITPLPLIGWEDFLRRICKVRGKCFCVTNREQESNRRDQDLPLADHAKYGIISRPWETPLGWSSPASYLGYALHVFGFSPTLPDLTATELLGRIEASREAR